MTPPQGEVVPLASGAEMRVTGEGATAVVCVNGGQAAEVEGTWSASLEWLVRRLAPRFPAARLRRGALPRSSRGGGSTRASRTRARRSTRSGAGRTLLLGFSMGGAVAISAARRAVASSGVLGLAPWIPDRLSLEPLRGKRLDVLHGSLDRWLPGIPGVSPAVVAARVRACPRRSVSPATTS